MDGWRTTYKGIVPDTYLDKLSYESREQMWISGIEQNSVYIAEDKDGQIVGFASGRKELGRKLIQTVVDDLKERKLNSMLIWALKENRACRFYEILGGKGS